MRSLFDVQDVARVWHESLGGSRQDIFFGLWHDHCFQKMWLN